MAEQSQNTSGTVPQQSPNSPPTLVQCFCFFCVFLLELGLGTITRSTASKFASGGLYGNVQQKSGAKVMADLLFGSAA